MRHAYFPLNAVMRYARRHKLIRANPCEDVSLPKQLPRGRAKVEGHFLSRDQVEALASHLDNVDAVDGLLVRFAAGVGLRASEIAALRVRDLRVARREVFVERMAKKQYPGGTWLFAETKNRQKRAVPILDDDLLDRLSSFLAGHPRRDELDAPLWPGRDRYGVTYGASGDDHLWDESTWYRVWFRPAVRALGLPAEAHTGVRFHDLRHTAGSQWLEDGHNMFAVSRWLGHSNISTTDAIYAHVAKTPDYSAALAITRSAKGR